MIRRLSFDHTPKELAWRCSGTADVALLWSRRKNRAAVLVEDKATGEQFEIFVGKDDDPMDVFEHPYAYAASRRRRSQIEPPARRAGKHAAAA